MMNNKKEQSKDNNREVETKFLKGFCQYSSRMAEQIPDEYNCFSDTDWKDGYYSFSHTEIRQSEFHNNKNLKDEILNKKNSLLYNRISLNGEPTYLMEIGLWRNKKHSDNGIEYMEYEEISIERDDNVFFMQEWKLNTGQQPDSSWMECYYKKAETKQSNGNELQSIEIIIPEKRLHFFLTTGGIKS